MWSMWISSCDPKMVRQLLLGCLKKILEHYHIIWHRKGYGAITFLLLRDSNSSLCFQLFQLLQCDFHAFFLHSQEIFKLNWPFQRDAEVLTWLTWLQAPTKITRTGDNLRLFLLWIVPFSKGSDSPYPKWSLPSNHWGEGTRGPV